MFVQDNKMIIEIIQGEGELKYFNHWLVKYSVKRFSSLDLMCLST